MRLLKVLLLSMVLGYSLLFGATTNEINALKQFYKSTNGSSWTNKKNWNSKYDPCDRNHGWYGVVCGYPNGAFPSVVEIRLPNNNLSGNIPDVFSLNLLPYVGLLDLSNNKLSGSIPYSLGGRYLEHLFLNNNNLSGSIPASLAKQATTSILQTLNLSSNNFTGTIHSDFGYLLNLKVLDVSNNKLTGNLPSTFANLVNLNELWINDNSMTGNTPITIQYLKKLTHLAIGGNNFNGKLLLPSNSPTMLKVLYLHDMNFGGTLDWIRPLKRLEIFAIDKNFITGSIPTWINELSYLKIFSVTDNDMVGQIPSNITKLPNLTELWLNYNKFSGTIPSSMKNLSKVTSLVLHHNSSLTTGDSSLISFINSKKDDATHSGQTNYQYILTTNSTKPSPNRSDLVAFYNSLGGANWYHKTNWNSQKSTCSWYGIKCDATGTKITEINLLRNNLKGNLPTQIGNFTDLTLLLLARNDITGRIPTEIQNLKNLTFLNLSQNKITSMTAIKNLKKLKNLYLRDNKLELASKNIATLDSIQILDLSYNNIVGSVSNYIDAIKDTITKGQLHLHNNYNVAIPDNKIVTVNSIGYAPNSSTATNYIKNTNKSGMYSDKQVLSNLYNVTGGTNWKHNTNWLEGYPCTDKWYGITCENGRVTKINLSNNNLTGKFPRSNSSSSYSLQKITTLKYLNLSNNNLYGTVEYAPSSNSHSMTSAGSIVLEYNYNLKLTAASTAFLNQYGYSRGTGKPYSSYVLSKNTMKSAQQMYLGYFYLRTNGKNWTNNTNWMSDTVPACNWYGITCDSDGYITEIRLEKNNLVSQNAAMSVPKEFREFPKLQTLYLSNNKLSGDLDYWLPGLKSLRWLRLDQNNFSGSIPSSISKASRLEELYLDHNNFSGSIPKEITYLYNMHNLRLNSNALTGSIPASIGNLTKVHDLYLQFNNLSGTIPDSIVNLKNMSDGKLRLYKNCKFTYSNSVKNYINKYAYRSSSSYTGVDFLERLSKKCGGNMSTILYLLLN